MKYLFHEYCHLLFCCMFIQNHFYYKQTKSTSVPHVHKLFDNNLPLPTRYAQQIHGTYTIFSSADYIYIYIIYNILMRGQRRKTLTQTVQYFNHPTMVRRFIYIMTIIQHTILHTYQWPVYSCTSQQPSSVTSSDTNVIESI